MLYLVGNRPMRSLAARIGRTTERGGVGGEGREGEGRGERGEGRAERGEGGVRGEASIGRMV
jgi:hypothetical protein